MASEPGRGEKKKKENTDSSKANGAETEGEGGGGRGEEEKRRLKIKTNHYRRRGEGCGFANAKGGPVQWERPIGAECGSQKRTRTQTLRGEETESQAASSTHEGATYRGEIKRSRRRHPRGGLRRTETTTGKNERGKGSSAGRADKRKHKRATQDRAHKQHDDTACVTVTL